MIGRDYIIVMFNVPEITAHIFEFLTLHELPQVARVDKYFAELVRREMGRRISPDLLGVSKLEQNDLRYFVHKVKDPAAMILILIKLWSRFVDGNTGHVELQTQSVEPNFSSIFTYWIHVGALGCARLTIPAVITFLPGSCEEKVYKAATEYRGDAESLAAKSQEFLLWHIYTNMHVPQAVIDLLDGDHFNLLLEMTWSREQSAELLKNMNESNEALPRYDPFYATRMLGTLQHAKYFTIEGYLLDDWAINEANYFTRLADDLTCGCDGKD